VAELILAFYRHALEHYQRDTGTHTTEVPEFRRVLKLLREPYGELDVREFGPLKLKAIREHMVLGGLCRRVVNQRAERIVRVFRWGVAEEMVPAEVYQAL
jgi:hypothetical protein